MNAHIFAVYRRFCLTANMYRFRELSKSQYVLHFMQHVVYVVEVLLFKLISHTGASVMCRSRVGTKPRFTLKE